METLQKFININPVDRDNKIHESVAIIQTALNIHLDTEDTEGPTSPENSPTTINKFSRAFFFYSLPKGDLGFSVLCSCKLISTLGPKMPDGQHTGFYAKHWASLYCFFLNITLW